MYNCQRLCALVNAKNHEKLLAAKCQESPPRTETRISWLENWEIRL